MGGSRINVVSGTVRLHLRTKAVCLSLYINIVQKERHIDALNVLQPALRKKIGRAKTTVSRPFLIRLLRFILWNLKRNYLIRTLFSVQTIAKRNRRAAVRTARCTRVFINDNRRTTALTYVLFLIFIGSGIYPVLFTDLVNKLPFWRNLVLRIWPDRFHLFLINGLTGRILNPFLIITAFTVQHPTIRVKYHNCPTLRTLKFNDHSSPSFVMVSTIFHVFSFSW